MDNIRTRNKTGESAILHHRELMNVCGSHKLGRLRQIIGDLHHL